MNEEMAKRIANIKSVAGKNNQNKDAYLTINDAAEVIAYAEKIKEENERLWTALHEITKLAMKKND